MVHLLQQFLASSGFMLDYMSAKGSLYQLSSNRQVVECSCGYFLAFLA